MPITVVANSLQGHSGLIDHFAYATPAPNYDGIFVQGLSVQGRRQRRGRRRDHASPARCASSRTPRDGLVVGPYTIVLTRAPEESVRITAAPVAAQRARAPRRRQGHRCSRTDRPHAGTDAGVTLLFDRDNWFIPQTVTVTRRADTLAEGTLTIPIQHRIIQGAQPGRRRRLRRLVVPGVTVEVVDDDAATVAGRRSTRPRQRRRRPAAVAEDAPERALELAALHGRLPAAAHARARARRTVDDRRSPPTARPAQPRRRRPGRRAATPTLHAAPSTATTLERRRRPSTCAPRATPPRGPALLAHHQRRDLDRRRSFLALTAGDVAKGLRRRRQRRHRAALHRHGRHRHEHGRR